jgi:hypothetical protein
MHALPGQLACCRGGGLLRKCLRPRQPQRDGWLVAVGVAGTGVGVSVRLWGDSPLGRVSLGLLRVFRCWWRRAVAVGVAGGAVVVRRQVGIGRRAGSVDGGAFGRRRAAELKPVPSRRQQAGGGDVPVILPGTVAADDRAVVRPQFGTDRRGPEADQADHAGPGDVEGHGRRQGHLPWHARLQLVAVQRHAVAKAVVAPETGGLQHVRSRFKSALEVADDPNRRRIAADAVQLADYAIAEAQGHLCRSGQRKAPYIGLALLVAPLRLPPGRGLARAEWQVVRSVAGDIDRLGQRREPNHDLAGHHIRRHHKPEMAGRQSLFDPVAVPAL